MPRLSREKSQERTRERLLTAAAKVFARAGYGGASIDAIAEDAGFSKGAFYSNFDSKESVFLELLERHMAQELAAGGGLLDGALTPDAAVDLIAERYARDGDDQMWCLLSIEFALHAARSPSFAARYAALFDTQYRGVAEIVVRLAALAGRQVDDPFSAAVAFVAFRNGLAIDRGAPEPRLGDAAARAVLGRFVHALIGGGGA